MPEETNNQAMELLMRWIQSDGIELVKGKYSTMLWTPGYITSGLVNSSLIREIEWLRDNEYITELDGKIYYTAKTLQEVVPLVLV